MDMNRLNSGQEIETTIVAISGDTVFLDLNLKSEGVLNSAELLDKEGNLTVKEGDKIKAYFVGNKNGEMTFTTKIASDKADKSMLESAYKSGIPVEGRVEKEIKGGFEVKIGDSRAFCPYSQMGFKEKEEAAFYIGKVLTFKIQEYKENGRNILVSNRAILSDEHDAQLDTLRESLKEGMTVQCVVKSIQTFGAFVEFQGIQALLPISEISMSRIKDVNEVLQVGQEITVQILKLDWKTQRFSVSMKALIADPWDAAATHYIVGDKYEGTISRIADFGLFVNLEPGIDGLLHISELQDADRSTNLRKKYKTGEKLTVLIKGIDTAEKRISLMITQTSDEDVSAANYLKNQADEGDTYNPFAALLKKK